MPRKFRHFVLTSLLTMLIATGAAEAVIHGEDDRRNFFDEKSELLKSYAGSVAIALHAHLIDAGGSVQGQYMGGAPFGVSSRVRNEWNLCPDERFADEFTLGAGGCTGFLIAADLLLTAGHCFREPRDGDDPVAQLKTIQRKCQDGKEVWVFDAYAATRAELTYLPNGANPVFQGISTKRFVPRQNVFRCKDVLYASPAKKADLLSGTFEDFAIVQLREAPAGRKVFPLADVAPATGGAVGMLGYPQGLLMKFVSKAEVTDSSLGRYFLANLDTFNGNSGSPVMDLQTGEVVGINVGATRVARSDDRIHDEAGACHRLPSLEERDGRAVVLQPSVFLPEVRRALKRFESRFSH